MSRIAARTPAGVFAVLTGDIIGSSSLSATQLGRTRALVLKGAQKFHSRSRPTVLGEPEFFRGDAWQLLLGEPARALRVALYIRALLSARLGVDTRISIGIGTAEAIDRSRTSLSTGEAFTLSGHALDEITGYFELTGALPDRAGALADWFPAILHLCSGLMRGWTRRQAEIVALALQSDNPTHERIAGSLRPPVSKQTVSDSLAGAGWRSLLEAIRVFERTDWLNTV
ncbi:MAG TPA: hypothetical protein VHE11_11180, partial [Steroidobacteraceae bacterium]|nr:hypothetical protein [Steroidobacteraceae bacterium]